MIDLKAGKYVVISNPIEYDINTSRHSKERHIPSRKKINDCTDW